jgi:hypothetical protein
MHDIDTVIHKHNFVDPNDNTIHTRSIESLWKRAKKKLRNKSGMKITVLMTMFSVVLFILLLKTMLCSVFVNCNAMGLK